MFYLERLIPKFYQRWLTLLGGFLIQFSLGSFYTLGNISPYIIVLDNIFQTSISLF